MKKLSPRKTKFSSQWESQVTKPESGTSVHIFLSVFYSFFLKYDCFTLLC